MKQKVFTSIIAGAALTLVLGACGAQETGGSAEGTPKNTTSKEQEAESNVLTLEAKNTEYRDGDFESSIEYKYDEFGNPVWAKSTQCKWSNYSSAYVGGSLQEPTKEMVSYEYTYEYEYEKKKVTSYIVRDSNGYEARCEKKYDKKGNLVKETQYYSDGTLDSVITYNTRGDILLKESYYMTEDGPIVAVRIVHEYDDMGNQLKEITYRNSKINGISTSDEYIISDACEWTYNDSGDLIKLIKYDQWDSTEEKDISFWQEYTYDDSHNVIKEIDYNENGFVSRWRISEYDENGCKTKTTYHDSDDSIQGWYEYACDTHGNITKETRYNSDGTVSRTSQYRYEYDTLGNKTRYIEYNSKGDISYEKDWKYDENGYLTEYTVYHYGVISQQIEYITIILK